jgi:hypothetical protein
LAGLRGEWRTNLREMVCRLYRVIYKHPNHELFLFPLTTTTALPLPVPNVARKR